MECRDVQQMAKDTITYVKTILRPGMSLPEIRELCEKKLLSLGADSFWYWDVGAFVFAGDETAFSVSGREYVTSDRPIQENDIITIDLSPQKDQIWGDYARTIILENGSVVDSVDRIQTSQWRSGLQMEELLHTELIRYVTPDTTFEQLYYHMNDLIAHHNYVNLDFLGNLGHSIVRSKDDRIYIEKGNTAKLSSVPFFTFEPHISTPGSKFGYKLENIYYFSGGQLLML